MPFTKGNQLWKVRKNTVLPIHRSANIGLEPSSEQWQLIVGGVLGDGCLVREEPQHNVYFTCAGTNRDYMIWKASILQSLCKLEQPRTKFRLPPRKTMYEVLTSRLSTLTDLYPLCYDNGKKMVSFELLDLVEPLALAIWFMDDGTLVKSRSSRPGSSARYALYTQSFGLEGNRLLVDFLQSRFDIEAKIYRDAGDTYLSIGVESGRLFRNIIEPYVVPSMYYKLDC